MKTVVFLKDHLNNKAGDSAEVTDEQANYFIRCKVAEEKKEEKKPAPTPEPKKEVPPAPAVQPAPKVEVKPNADDKKPA